MSHDDRDRDMERRLRNALAATADTVQPKGDALMRIQQRIGVRGTRNRWLRPVLVLGSAVVVAAITMGGIAIARHGIGPATVGPAQSPSRTPAANTVANDGFPALGIFPFTTTAEESSWQQQYIAGGHSPWKAEPLAVSLSWVQYYLLQKHVDMVMSKNLTDMTADITLGRNIGSTVHPVVIVHLVKFHEAWIVTGASAPAGDLTIASPAPGATGNSPLTVTGPGFGVDERATVEVRDAESSTLLGQAQTGMFGNGKQQWSATASFSPSDDGYGVIVVWTTSPADGGVGEIAAQKVAFTKSSPTSSASGFYGVQGDVIERFGADGTPQGPVPGSDANGTVTEVHRVNETLYYTTGSFNCASELRAMPTGGGQSTLAASADSGYGITGFDVTSAGAVAFFERGCGSHAGRGKLVFPAAPLGPDVSSHSVDFPSLPPVIAAGPVWEADGAHVDAFVRTGMEGYLARYDSTTGDNPMPSENACASYDGNNGQPTAVAAAPDGTLWFAVQTGTSMQVLSCSGGKSTVQLTIDKNATPESLAVDAAGNILLTDSDGNVWLGSAGGSATGLRTGGGVGGVSW